MEETESLGGYLMNSFLSFLFSTKDGENLDEFLSGDLDAERLGMGDA